MNYAGTDLKFRVTTTQPAFSLVEHDFEILIKDRYGRVRQRVKKEDCFWDSEDRCYFTVEDIRYGIFFAFFTGYYPDGDYNKLYRVFTDVQQLYEVGMCGCKCASPCQCKCGHRVQYEQIWTVNIDGEAYLCGSDGVLIEGSDGKPICFKKTVPSDSDDGGNSSGRVRLDTMTGEEFKQFIEGRTPDGRIDTVPELMDAMNGISDESTVKEEIKDDTENTYDESSRKLYLNGSKPQPEE